MTLNYEEMEYFINKFEERVEWLQRNIAPDDIYAFAQQALLGAEFMIYKYNEEVNIGIEMEKDSVLKDWVSNIMSVKTLFDSKKDVKVDISWKNP